jgi:hypothetical protein
MKLSAKRIGGIWHGTVEGHPEIDERGLTEEVAKRKAASVAARLGIALDGSDGEFLAGAAPGDPAKRV